MADQKDIQNQKDLNKEMSQTKSSQKDINNEMSITKSFEEQIIDLLNKRRGINSDVLSDQQDIANVLQSYGEQDIDVVETTAETDDDSTTEHHLGRLNTFVKVVGTQNKGSLYKQYMEIT